MTRPTTLTPPLRRSPLRDAIGAATRVPEPERLPALVDEARVSPARAATSTRSPCA